MSKNVVKKKNGKNVIYTILTFVLLSALFLSLAAYLYTDAENRAIETLHMQTKQIKDDLTLQIVSDRENLETMANFAEKLYLDGDDYSVLFDSFKPIGLITDIGILNPDNTFVMKSGVTNLDGKINFFDEVEKGSYISGRVYDITAVEYERVRSAVPIEVNGEVVGILYGIIKLENLERRYLNIATELDAQFFLYDNATGNLIIDTIHDELGNISFLKERQYGKDYSYEQFMASDNGYSSFHSAYRDENVLMHYSTIEDFGWKLALVRYDSQVYAETHTLLVILLGVFILMTSIMSIFSGLLMMSERRKNAAIDSASNIRKILIEASGNNHNIVDALREAVNFTKARSVIFFDAGSEDYVYISPEFHDRVLPEAQKITLKAELFRYVSRLMTQDDSVLRVICLRQNKQLAKSNPAVYALMKEHDIGKIVFSATIDHLNDITILAVIGPKHRADACYLAEKTSACFTIALNNHNNLSKTRQAVTTDALTGVLNRVAYNNDLHTINEEQPLDFSCIYIDVNELHYCNNKYGHAAGDEMLLFIAHTLQDVFFGQKVYRMGGDEFLVFTRDLDQNTIKKDINIFLDHLKSRHYHVAVGMSFRSQNTNTEEMVREAEVKMYESKAKYYQNKEQETNALNENAYVCTQTGIAEIDVMLAMLKENYNGIYKVSLDTDKAKRVLMPAYLGYRETEDQFSKLYAKYVSEFVDRDYHRSLLSFQNYDALIKQLAEGKIPKITYKKTNGETVTLSVHKLGDSNERISDTLWIFAKK